MTVRQIASALRLILRQITPEKPCPQLQVKKPQAKQADEAAKTNAAERLNAEMRAELRAVTAADERKRVLGKQDAKAIEF